MKSTHKSISCGVPQVSVLGPTLFLVYINDLPNSLKYFNIRLFADDSNLFHTFKLNERNVDLADMWVETYRLLLHGVSNFITVLAQSEAKILVMYPKT